MVVDRPSEIFILVELEVTILLAFRVDDQELHLFWLRGLQTAVFIPYSFVIFT
jgi:hypothetical protein